MNLTPAVCDTVAQPTSGAPYLSKDWHTVASNARMSGDVACVRGTASRSFVVSIGSSYQDRGVRGYQHDFFGVMLTVPLVPRQEPDGQASPSSRAPQPAPAETHATSDIDMSRDKKEVKTA